jgi:hypothetical protein
MTVTQTLKATLDATQRWNWRGANWGAFTRRANEKVADVLIAMLEEGIDLALLKDSYKFMDEVERRSGVGEITDTEPRNIVCLTLDEVRKGRIPMLRPDYNTDDDLWEDEDEDDWYSSEDWNE